MKEIELTRGMVALVDDEDYESLSQQRWYAQKGHHGRWYAARHSRAADNLPPRSTIYMHRVIMNAPPHLQVDHREGIGLDNRRKNLRLCTNGQNHYNCGAYATNSSGFKGVGWHKSTNKWRARISVDKKVIYLGNFDTAIEAAVAYEDAARKYHGDFARANF